MVKQHINAKYQIEFPEGSRLMETLGKNNLLLACIDSEDPELIIPHDLLNENNFVCTNLLMFKRSSDGL